ncbi:alpha/beta hydrolase [Alphaproteobacteria bacterium]|jgi:pimeloyl-ACP methyl ester carboxylesterase|nr:alpha/beta hydrolase [Alphaproteobacteria bacterium]
MTPPPSMPGPESHSYYSQRLRLHYVDWGNRDAPPLLLIHGGRDHCRNWDWVANELREQYHIIAPDLRGHGDSQWLIGGTYTLLDYVYDIAQLIEQMHLSPVTIIGHSLGGAVSLNYAGLCPGNVAKLVVIEGMGGRPTKDGKPRVVKPIEERVHGWVNILRRFSGREVRKYVSIEEAFNRMQEANPHLTPEQARHLTVHGANQNEDGTYSWKFDNYIRVDLPLRETDEERERLWSSISCPTLLFRGEESWASDPQLDGRMSHFQDAKLVNVADAGHWVQHDQLDLFLRETQAFLGS